MLLILALWIGIMLIPLGLVYTLIRNLNGIFTLGNKIAYLIDILGNVACSELFNDVTLIKKGDYLFGNPRDTISDVLAKNLFINNITATGHQLIYIIELHDYKHFHKIQGVFYEKETKEQKRKRIFKLILVYLIISFILLLLFLI